MLVVRGELEHLGGRRQEVDRPQDGLDQEVQVLLEEVLGRELGQVQELAEGRVERDSLVDRADGRQVLGQGQVQEPLRHLVLGEGRGRDVPDHALAHRHRVDGLVGHRPQEGQEQVQELRVLFQNRQEVLGEKGLDDGLLGAEADGLQQLA